MEQKITSNSEFEEKYNSVFQTLALLADTQNLFIEAGRGSGKTVEMFPPRMIRVACDMPRSTLLLASATYTSLITNIVPEMSTYLEQHYKKNYFYVIGKPPPKYFKDPYTPVFDYKHTISFSNGTIVQLVSGDRPESAIGKNAAHLFCDELLRIKETTMVERIMPTLRGDRQKFGKSHYFRGMSGYSSTPNFENDNDWWLTYENNMNEKLIKEIMAVALKIAHAKYKFHHTKSEKIKLNQARFIEKWENKIREKRKGATCYLKGSSFTNLLILGIDYIKDQLAGSKSNVEKFNLSVLGIRPKQVAEMFFGNFNKKNIYEDSYQYNDISLHSAERNYIKTSRDLKYCDPNKRIIAGMDPGNFMSIVFAQEQNNELRAFKNLYVIHPEQHFEMAKKIDEFFKYHASRYKSIELYYDRAGNQRKYKDNAKGETDATILKYELQKLGWTVQLKSLRQRTIYHWEHYVLLSILFGEKNPKAPKVKVCQYECEELISSIYLSPLKRNQGDTELDKSSEKKLKLQDQAYYSTQIPSAFMYLLFGLFEFLLPKKMKRQDYVGL